MKPQDPKLSTLIAHGKSLARVEPLEKTPVYRDGCAPMLVVAAVGLVILAVGVAGVLRPIGRHEGATMPMNSEGFR